MNRIIAAAICGALSGCLPSQQGYIEFLNPWIGQTEATLFSKWGAPDRTARSGSVTVYTYRRASQQFVPGLAPSYTVNQVGSTTFIDPVGGVPAYTYTETCETHFTVARHVITGVTFAGDGCVM